MAVLVKVRGLSKGFSGGPFGSGKTHWAVDRVDLDIERGKVTGLVGESGSGKSTLARLILRLVKADAGSVEFDGTDLGALGSRALRKLRARMQIVFQDPDSALDPRQPVGRSLGEGLDNLGVGRAERTARVLRAVDLVGISSRRLDDRPHQFSGGQKQRLVIARSLSMEPDFLVLDEPVSNLDVSVQAQIVNLLSDLRKELDLTYLFVSHDLDLVAYLSDTIAVMKDGALVEVGPGKEILENPVHAYTKELFSARPPFHEEAEVSLSW